MRCTSQLPLPHPLAELTGRSQQNRRAQPCCATAASQIWWSRFSSAAANRRASPSCATRSIQCCFSSPGICSPVQLIPLTQGHVLEATWVKARCLTLNFTASGIEASVPTGGYTCTQRKAGTTVPYSTISISSLPPSGVMFCGLTESHAARTGVRTSTVPYRYHTFE